MTEESAAVKFEEPSVAPGTVVVTEMGSGLTQCLLDGRHRLFADEPVSAGGADRGPGPYELLLMALGACTAMTLRLYARRKQWPLEHITVRLAHRRDHGRDSESSDTKPSHLDHIDCDIELSGKLDAAQRTRLLAIANQCPVHRSLTAAIAVTTRLLPSPPEPTPLP